ncbi:FecR family protein [Chitinophaga sp. S165]|uniref:FecR family protein n=1 Tax=Chitinophaga sp. S165 TaxID=2135462 RepID=UPI001304AE94|nr:FecR domain-containing protein [Chitinophaga sp. S165]
MQRELIDKYFRNECSDDERMLVLEYFRNHPEEWNKYMSEEDWDNFVTNEELAPELSEELFANVSRQTLNKTKRRTIAWLAAAVLVPLVIGAFWGYLTLRKTSSQEGVVTAGTTEQMIEKKNVSDTLMNILMDDGSMVMLSPGSGIRYYEKFVSRDNREVYLSGKAIFDVGIDKGRPFIVYADRLATTVLGTSFTVESFAQSSVITVKLHKGKIQVAAADIVQEKWNGREILLPGDEFIYDKTTMLASIKRNMPAEQMVKAGPAYKEDNNVRRPDLYTFDISPLSDVFDQLSNYYQVEIYYYPSDVKNKYFSGRMHKTDSLGTILNDIATLNQLKIEKEKERYIIRKKD